MANFITTVRLNLRRQPIKGDNIICVMPLDTVVEEIQPQVRDGFREVKTKQGNVEMHGFASQKYLDVTTLGFPEDEPLMQLPRVHYPAGNRVITRNGDGRVYPLNENAMPMFDLSKIESESERKKAISDVLDFLDVEKSKRYAPDFKNTYCNIYAYDVAYCLGAFLPRVWWTPDAILKHQAGATVPVQYDRTVTEMTANRIADWFEKFGESFTWDRMTDVNSFQDEVNKGRLGILVAQRINPSNPGHIVAVVPEAGAHAARRTTGGSVIVPLQSQAGRTNRKYSSSSPWWLDNTRFAKFSFWITP